MPEILYTDDNLIFVKKAVGVSSETELPQMIKDKIKSDVFPVHRLDVPVSGVMVYARNKKYAALLCEKIASGNDFQKTYLAVVEGEFSQKEGEFSDLLFKDKAKNKSFVVKRERKGVRRAALTYQVLETALYNDKILNLVKINLETGRSHQIRVQFASRKHFLTGDGKYGSKINCPLALFSVSIKTMGFDISSKPPNIFPWNLFKNNLFIQTKKQKENLQ